MSAPPAPTWYAVHTHARKEPMVHQYLQRQGFETLFLYYGTVVKHARRTRRVIRAYFTRYVFVGVHEGQGLYDVNRGPGVSTVVYLGDKPLDIPAAVIEELRARGDSAGRVQFLPKERAEHRRQFCEGEQVQIVAGPLAGLLAIVVRDNGTVVKSWVKMFDRETLVEYSPDHLKSMHNKHLVRDYAVCEKD